MGCLVKSGILNPDKTLTQQAKDNFIKEVKELVIYGSEGLPTPIPFTCGEPLQPNSDLTLESFDLENEEKWASFHRDVIKNKYEKFAAALDVESAQSLLPLIADPIALAGKFGVELPEISFPDGYLPYFSGLLLPKFVLDLLKAEIPDYFLPPLLAAKLPEFISLPSPPNISPLIPTFEPPVPGIPDLPSPEFPSIPAVGLADLVAVDLALAEQIPKLLADLIAEMPKLLLKLPDIGSVFSDLCKKIRDSGVFGKSEPYETVKQATDTVLSRKLMSCLFLAAVGSTIGVSEGSLGPTIAKNVLNESPPPKPPPKIPQNFPSPADLVARRASTFGNSGGISYGNNRSTYVNTLFYYEAACATFEPGTVSAYGFPLPEKRLPPRTLDTSGIANLLQGKQGSSLNYSPTRDYSDDGPNSWGVEDTRGLLRYADRQAQFASACGLFARACLYFGGAKNFYFLSQYPSTTAIDALRGLAIIKNYEWVDANGLINEDLYNFARSLEQTTNTAFSTLIKPWDLDKNGKSNSSAIDQYVRRGSRKVSYHVTELAGMAERGEPFPALDAGDMILLKDPSGTDSHAFVVTEPRRATKFASKDSDGPTARNLDPPIITVEGGQLDTQNFGSASSIMTGDTGPTELEQVVNTFGKYFPGNDSPPITPKELPTAIRAGAYEFGFFDGSNKAFSGYYLAKKFTSTFGTSEVANSYQARNRRVEIIIKTNNFLELDNLDSDEAAFALSVIDDSPALRFIEKSLSDKQRIAMMVEDIYPTYPRPKRNKT